MTTTLKHNLIEILSPSDCPAGTYYSGNAAGDEICAKCAKGAYSESRSMFCLSCPDGDTTAGLGATSPDECYPESEEGELPSN